MSLRERRIDEEWKLLQKLAEVNPRVLAGIDRSDKGFLVELRESPAWAGTQERPEMVREHAMRYVFPRYYPALPLEGYLARPVLHPNVDAVNGFVCLWRSYCPEQTIVDAVVITRAVLSWNAVNGGLEHRMQRAGVLAALEKPDLTIPDGCRVVARAASARMRLEAEAMDYAR